EGVGMFDRFRALRALRSTLHAALHLDLMVKGLETQERSGAEEAIAAQAFAADDAFEQERPVAFLDLAEGTDRGERITDQLAIDRHEAGVAGQLDKLFQAGTVTHEYLRESTRLPNPFSGLHGCAAAEKGA